MSRSYSQSASALALAVAFISLYPQLGNAQTAPVQELPTVEVTTTPEGEAGGGEGVNAPNQGYSAPPVKQSTTKIDVPTFDLPVAVATVPEQVIQDQNAISVQDALQNVSGVQTYTGLQSDLITNIRGFDTLKAYRDGLLIEGNNGLVTSFDTANLQRIDVLKGPASFLFGRADPGGIINYVTKKPLDAPYYSVEQQGGSFNLLRTVWDLTGPVQVLDNGAVSYRFSGSYTKGGQFIDFIDNDQTFLAPAITWHIDPATTLTIDAEYQRRDRQRFAGIPAIGMYPASLPVYRSFEEPNEPLARYRTSLIAEEFNHHFDNNWAITSRFLAVRGTFQQIDLNATSFPNPPFLVRPILFQLGTGTNYSTNLDLTGKFDVLGAKNDVLIGADYFYQYSNFVLSQNGSFPINIFNPVYGTVPTSAFQSAGFLTFAGKTDGFTFFTPHAEKDLGMYVQDLITPFEGLHVLLGTRYDLADVRDGFTGTNFSTFPPIQPSFGQAYANFGRNPVQHSQVPSPHFGLVYQPVPWIGFYGSYTRSFGLPNGISTTNTPFPPQIAVGWEGGVKTELLDSRLTATLAFFDITKSNVLSSAPTPTNPFAVRTIDARSQGAELDVLGKLTDELSVIGSYSHIDARIINDNGGLLGHSLHVYAPDSGSLYLTYDFAPGSELRGWRAGGGVFAASNRWGDDQNTFILPAYARLDAFARYQTVVGPTRVSAQINVYNITNTKYYTGVSFFGNPRVEIFPGAPRSIIASLRVEY